MTDETRKVCEAALLLPEQDRVRLIGQLLESLPSDSDLADDELFAELERRVEEGLEGAVSWEQLRHMR